MEKLIFDTGVREFDVNGAVLRFNPSDPNVYARFVAAAEKLMQVESQMVAEGNAAGEDGGAVLRAMEKADRQVKDILADVFGPGNDFNAIFGGINAMAVGANGERVLTNFLYCVGPVLEAGARRCAEEQVEKALRERESRMVR